MSRASPSREGKLAAVGLAAYAVSEDAPRRREHPEPDIPDDSTFERDRYRIYNSMSFRRLMYKTQVFVVSVAGDHFRTRLTHTLEVAAQAQILAMLLRLNDRLARAAALAHDLGHPPFGHAGELELAMLMKDHGGFEHNLQALRVVDYLEHPYPDFRGLNLAFEIRESLIKHRTLYDHPDAAATTDEGTRTLLATGPSAPLEGQVVNLADTIAYTLHDIEDALGQGTLDEEILNQSVLWREAAEPVRKKHPKSAMLAVRRPILDRLGRGLCGDAAGESRRRIAGAGIETIEAVRRHTGDLVSFSPGTAGRLQELHGLLLEHVYRHHRVVRMDAKARRLIRELFEAYLADSKLLPRRFQKRIDSQGLQRVVCDYVSGMTDRFAQEEHRRLFAPFYFE